jgi:fucose permease
MQAWADWAATPAGRGAILYNAGYLSLGMCLSEFGPVLLDLAAQTGATIQATGFVLTARSFAYLCGAACGPLFDRLPGHALLATAMTLCALGTALVPAARSSAALAACVSMQGVGMGLLDTGCNLLLLWWYGDRAGPFLQAMHCSFGVGATVGPLLLRAVESAGAGAYLDASGAKLVGVGAYNMGFYITAILCASVAVGFVFSVSPLARGADGGGAPPAAAAATAPAAVLDDAGSGALSAQTGTVAVDDSAWDAAAAGGAAEAAAVPIAAAEGKPAPLAAAAEGALGPPAVPVDVKALERESWVVVGIAAALLGIYVGAETGFGAYVTAYAVLSVGSTESHGQLLAGAYWAAITVGRFASIWIASAVRPVLFLRVSMGAAAVAMAFLLLAGGTAAGLWVGSIAFGLAMATVFPTTFSLVESFIPVLGKHATVLMIGSATGEMVLPALIALCFGDGADAVAADASTATTTATPRALLWIVAAACVANVGMLEALQRAGAKRVARAHGGVI